MKVVTSGKKYIDIDAYASCIAYRELLRLQGEDVVAVSTVPLNESVTESLRKLPVGLDDYVVREGDEFVVLDVSNPDFFDVFVVPEGIVEIIDHHPGFEKYWEERAVKSVQIEPIGAVATIVVEKFEKAGLLEDMRPEIAKLLMAAILDNTLNFKAKITSERDKVAYAALMRIAEEDEGFAEAYFRECQDGIEEDLKKSIRNDVKVEKIKYALPEVIGQLTCWNGGEILERQEEILEVMNELAGKWMINIISLSDGKGCILTSDGGVAKEVLRLFGGAQQKNMVTLEKVWLRKELMKRAMGDARV